MTRALQNDETVGYALIGADGKPYVDTVFATERGAKVLALVRMFGRQVMSTAADASIDEAFEQDVRGTPLRVAPVYIGPLEVEG